VTFAHPFVISGYCDELPPGSYEFVLDEEPLHGLSFEAYRRTASYLVVANQPGRTEMRPIDPRDLEAALIRDRALSQQCEKGEVACFPLEDQS
jgi:hypothetical protein